MYLLIWNGTVHSYGDAGKKDGIVHAGGDDHGSRADEKCDALRNVSVHGESGCGSGDGCGIRSLNSDAMHSGDPGAVVTGAPTVLVGNTPALNQSSKTICAYGGVIQITNPGTTNIQIP